MALYESERVNKMIRNQTDITTITKKRNNNAMSKKDIDAVRWKRCFSEVFRFLQENPLSFLINKAVPTHRGKHRNLQVMTNYCNGYTT